MLTPDHAHTRHITAVAKVASLLSQVIASHVRAAVTQASVYVCMVGVWWVVFTTVFTTAHGGD